MIQKKIDIGHKLRHLLDFDKKYINKKVYMIIVVVMFFLFSVFTYTDIAITTRNGINVWESIFQGKFFQYYSMNLHLDIAGGRYGNYSAMYNIAMYIIFALWDFPLWIIEKVFNIDTLEFWPGILYAKSILILLLLFTIAQIKAVCKELGYDDWQCTYAWILFATSIFFFNSVVEIGQYDLISIAIMLKGIKYYLRNDERRFIWCFGIAFLFKLFALLPFFALLIIREKRIVQIIIKTIETMALYIFTELLFYITDYSAKVKMLKSTNSLTEYLVTTPILSSLMYFYLGIFLILLVYCVCYFFISKKNNNYDLYAVYVPFLIFSAFFVGCYANPYWIIMVEPFACILIVKESKLVKTRMICETIFSIGYTIGLVMVHSWTYSIALVKYSWLGIILEKWHHTKGTFGKVPSIASVLEANSNMNTEVVAGFAISLFLVGILVFSIITHPKSNSLEIIESEESFTLIFVIRFICGVLFCLLPIGCYFFI